MDEVPLIDSIKLDEKGWLQSMKSCTDWRYTMTVLRLFGLRLILLLSIFFACDVLACHFGDTCDLFGDTCDLSFRLRLPAPKQDTSRADSFHKGETVIPIGYCQGKGQVLGSFSTPHVAVRNPNKDGRWSYYNPYELAVPHGTLEGITVGNFFRVVIKGKIYTAKVLAINFPCRYYVVFPHGGFSYRAIRIEDFLLDDPIQIDSQIRKNIEEGVQKWYEEFPKCFALIDPSSAEQPKHHP